MHEDYDDYAARAAELAEEEEEEARMRRSWAEGEEEEVEGGTVSDDYDVGEKKAMELEETERLLEEEAERGHQDDGQVEELDGEEEKALQREQEDENAENAGHELQEGASRKRKWPTGSVAGSHCQQHPDAHGERKDGRKKEPKPSQVAGEELEGNDGQQDAATTEKPVSRSSNTGAA